nr:hypothetical protein [Tanacetum cinerariifolium]
MSTKEHEKRHRSRRSCSPRTSVFSRIRRERLRGKSVSARSDNYNQHPHSRYTEALSESEDIGCGHWKSRSKKKKSSGEEEDLSQPCVCEETDPFTPRIRYFDFPKTRMPNHIKTYGGSEYPKDHLKIFQAAAKTKQWAMQTWCHMFNSTWTGNARVWFDDLPPESIDSYDDLKKAFLENYLRQKKYIKYPIELHNNKQRDGESTKDFLSWYKLESRDVKGAPECMRVSGFVHGITNPELIKRIHDKIPKTVDEMMRVTTSFLRGEVGKEARSLLTTHKNPQEIFTLDKGNVKALPPMTTLVEKQNHAKFCEFHGEVGHNTDECMHLRKEIEEMLKAGKLSHLIKVLKQNNGKEQPKSFSPNLEIFFPTLGEDEGAEGPMIIEAKIGGHCIHHIGEIIWPIRQIQLLVKIGDEERSASAWMNFMVVRSQYPYNGIIRRPGVRKLQAVLSTAYGMLKILVEGGVITLKSSKLVPRECAMVFRHGETPSAAKPIIKERVKVAINPEYPKQTVMISFTLTERGRNKLCGLLQRNLDVFAWKPADMIGVPKHIMEHRLNVWEGCSPVRQKKR